MKRRQDDITPDEIFLDSSNLSSFNTSQFEGRIEKPISKRTFVGITILLCIVFSVFAGRLWYLQINKGQVYAQISENNRLQHIPVFAERGVIFDRNGERLAWNVPNQETDDFSLREYADIPGIAHLVGYVTHPKKDSSGFYYQYYFEGKTGSEKAFDEVLTGNNGIKISETDALSDILSESVIEDPVPGENLYLSVDSRIQSQLYEIIKGLAEEKGFTGGAGALMNVETGELVALTSYPEYSLQGFTDRNNDIIEETLNDSSLPLLNRATGGLYTPGSIVKPFMGLAALNERVIDPLKEILSTGKLAVPNPYNPDQPTIFTDWKAHGYVNLHKALAISSNIYFYQVGGGFGSQRGIGITKIGEYMREFGFSSKTGIELGGEEAGVVPSPEWKAENFNGDDWRLGDTYNTSIGQYGFQVTPIQAVRAVAAIANGGVLFEPTIQRSDGTTADIVNIVDVPSEHFEEVRKGMRMGVEEGISQGLSVPYVKMAAKTGTAELGVSKDKVNAWVTGFFPYDDPKYAFTILMEEGPVKNTVGGVFVMRTLLDWMHKNTPEYFDL